MLILYQRMQTVTVYNNVDEILPVDINVGVDDDAL